MTLKIYSDERINKLIKDSFGKATKDSEWSIRDLSEWSLLYECIDKVLDFVDSNYTKEIYVNRNMWWVLQDTFFNVCDLYGVDIVASDKVSEKELLIKKDNNNNIEVSNQTKTYIKNVCNYLNNIKGYIERGEVVFLLECIEDKSYINILTDKDIKKLSDYVEYDECDKFLNELINIANRLDTTQLTNERNKCPKCGSEDLDYETIRLEGEQCYFPYKCNNCGLRGEEWYSLEFCGHNIYNENNELIEL